MGKASGVVEARTERSITFRVDEVEPARGRLPELRAHAALARELGARPEACWDYTSSVVDAPRAHGLLHAIHLAFSQHRPLVLAPDHVWLTIVQGLGHHVQADPERWRSRLVTHSGRAELRIRRDDFAGRSPENPWPLAFSALAALVRERGRSDAVDLIRARFSTTGPVEQAAYDVAVLDAFAPYFDYVMVCMCGIPAVTLEGTVADWDDLSARVDRLDGLGLELGWWTERLRPIATQFARARRGDVDLGHWRGIYKLEKAYGADRINGWAAQLVPYLKDGTGRPTRRSPALTGEHRGGITAASLPTGLASVPLTCVGPEGPRAVLLVAGHAGIEQRADLGLRPRIGWAVVQASVMDQLLARLREGHSVRPAAPPAERRLGDAPAALMQLYDRCDGATLHGRAGLRLLPLSESDLVCFDGERFVERGRDQGCCVASYRGRTVLWRSFAALEDGARLAIDLAGLGRGRPARVVRYHPGQVGPGRCRCVAPSLEAALERLLARPDPVFDDLGDPLA